MKLTKKLQNCENFNQALPILNRVGARTSTKKLIETTFTLLNSSDPMDQTSAVKSMKKAFKELEKDGLADNDVHEEELSNNNQGERTEGSEQSTDNESPYPGEGKDSTSGDKDMQKMDGAIDQWNEMDSPSAGVSGYTPPSMPPGANPTSLPPPQQQQQQQPTGVMNTPTTGQLDPQLMQYIQSVIQQAMQNYHSQVTNKTKEIMGRVISEFTAKSNQQKEAIKKLSQTLQETISSSNTMKYDLDYLRENATARLFRETVPVGMAGEFGVVRHQNKPYSKYNDLTQARAEINAMDSILKSR